MNGRWWRLALAFAAYASIATLAAGVFVGSGFGLGLFLLLFGAMRPLLTGVALVSVWMHPLLALACGSWVGLRVAGILDLDNRPTPRVAAVAACLIGCSAVYYTPILLVFFGVRSLVPVVFDDVLPERPEFIVYGGVGLFGVSMTVAFFVARLFLRPRAKIAAAATHSGASTPN